MEKNMYFDNLLNTLSINTLSKYIFFSILYYGCFLLKMIFTGVKSNKIVIVQKLLSRTVQDIFSFIFFFLHSY